MNEIIQAMMARRSVRKYKPDPVPRELIDQVVTAGTYAPTGMGRQAPLILAVTDPEMRDRLSKANAQIMGNPSIDPFYGAPAVLVVLAEKDCFTSVYDGTLVMANLMLAAHSLGLGSCWIHRAKEEFEQPEWKEFLASLGVEGEYMGIGHCILGYPDGPLPAPAPRKNGYVRYV